MKQVLHIFRKDVRRHWPEIAVSIALAAVYGWVHWRHSDSEDSIRYFRLFLSDLVVPLMAISWSLLIVHVVQSENLVGDQQFWVTRPYDWRKLLVAKVLFVLVFINMPLLIVDGLLLADAGFQPLRYIGGLLLIQLLLWMILVLPAAAAAAVTATIAETVLVALVTGLYIVGFGWLIAAVPNATIPSVLSLTEGVEAFVALAACAVVVVWQYGRRKTWQSRAVLVSMAVIVLAIGGATPYSAVIAREYPALAESRRPVQLAPESVAKYIHQNPQDARPRKTDLTVSFPLQVSGILPDTLIAIDGIQFTITAPQGPPWKSDWLRFGAVLTPNRGRTHVSVIIPRNVYDRVRFAPVKVHIALALTDYREGNARTVIVTEGDFSVPDLGICVNGTGGNIVCRTALNRPIVIASIDTTTMTCPPSKGRPPMPPGIRLTSENWDRTSAPAKIGTGPVQLMNLLFRDWAQTLDSYGFPGACPGTPVRFTTPEVAQRFRNEVELDDVYIDDYWR
jgi:hypothetical protein